MKRLLLIGFVTLWLISGCAKSKVNYLTLNKYDAKPKNCELKVYFDKFDSENTIVIAQINAPQRKTEKDVLIALKETACEIGADGIANVQYEHELVLVRGSAVAFRNKLTE